MKFVQRLSLGLALLGLTITGEEPLFAKVGFGLGPFKKPIELQARQPAAVRLANTSVYFEGASTNKEYFPVQDSLLVTLGTELISNEKSLVLKDKQSDAQWTFAANITGYSVSPPGTRSERSGNDTITYTVWNGSLNVAYRVIDQHGTVYDAANVDYNYNKAFQQSATGDKKTTLDVKTITDVFGPHRPRKPTEVVPGTPEDVKQILIKEVVKQIAAKLGNTTQTIEDVQVAGGEENLNHAAEFMKNGLWARALESLQKAPTFPKSDEEAFHQYDIGLAYEAMSYSSKSSAEQRENIFKAAEYYDKALELNPNNKYFVQTIARARDAVARYQALDKMKLQDQKTLQAKNLPASQGDDAKTMGDPVQKNELKPPSKIVTLADVLEMRSAGVGDDQIIDYIRSASNVQFDPTDKDTMIAIAKAKLPVSLQNALRQKVKAPLLTAPRQTKNGGL
jgi:tetratricopeptide (TPR) repeat protein